jgi:hypothetical protein
MNKAIGRTVWLCLCLFFVGSTAMAQKVLYNYNRGTNFNQYKTYQWAAIGGLKLNPITQKNIQQAIERQLALKGLRKVEQNGDLDVAYRTGMSREKQISGWRTGPRWTGGAMATTSTTYIGMLIVDMYDPATRQLVWRGEVSKALHLSNNADKNHKNLQKAIAKLFKKYPPTPR